MTGYAKDISGQRYGRLVALELIPRPVSFRVGTFWRCRCDCGNIKVTTQAALHGGVCKSCGCLRAETYASAGRLGGLAKDHGDACNKTGKCAKEYRAWQNIKQRCFNKNHKSFANYGGRGVTICKRWLHSYHNFLADVGRAPGSQFSIDRINVNGNYTPRNVRWATPKTQANNRRVTQCA